MSRNIFYKKGWIYGAAQMHVEPIPIPEIKSKIDTNKEKD